MVVPSKTRKLFQLLLNNYRGGENSLLFYEKGEFMVNYRNRGKFRYNIDNVKKDILDKQPVKMKSTQYSYVSLIKDRLTDRETKKYWERAYDISDPRFSTSLDYSEANLPYYNTDKSLKFFFTQDMLDEMLKTPKVLIKTHEYSFVSDSGEDLTGNRFYLLAPWLVDKDLPIIYRLDVVRSKNREYFGMRANAIVGGCQDGACPLLEITHYNKRDYSTIYQASPSTINPDLKECPAIDVDIKTPEDACSYLFDLFGVKYIQTENMGTSKIFEKIASFRKNKELYGEISGAEFIARYDAKDVQNSEHYEFVHEDASIENVTDRIR